MFQETRGATAMGLMQICFLLIDVATFLLAIAALLVVMVPQPETTVEGSAMRV